MTSARLALAALLALGGCVSQPYVPVPWPVRPPPVVPVDPPPTPPPVTPPDQPAPASLDAFLARIVVGATVAEAAAATGVQPVVVPASGPSASTARWALTLPEGAYLVVAVLDASGRVVRTVSDRLWSNP